MKKINLLFAFFTCFIPLAAEKVEVIFSDNSSKEYDIEELRAFSNTFLNLLEGQSGEGIQIPLADIKSEIFNNLVELKFHCDVYCADSSNPLIESGVISDYPEDLLIELANLANFLDSPILLKGLLAEINKRLIQNPALKEDLEKHLDNDLLGLFYTFKGSFQGRFRSPVISGSGNKIVLIGEESGLFVYDGNLNFIKSINNIRFNFAIMSSDGRRIVAVSEDCFVYILDGSGYIIKKINYKDNISYKFYPDIKISDDGNKIFILKKDGFVYIYDQNGDIMNSINDRSYKRIRISSDGSRIAAQFNNTEIYLFDGDGNSIDFIVYENNFFEFVASDDCNRLVLLTHNSFIVIFDFYGKHIKTIKNTKFNSIKISSDGTIIAAIGADNFIYIFDADGNLIRVINDRKYSYFEITVDANKIVAYGKDGYDIYIFDLKDLFENSIAGYGRYWLFSISNDAKKIIALRNDSQVDLFWLLN